MTQKTVTCIGVRPKPKGSSKFEDRQFTFLFSVTGPSIPGRPKDQYTVEVNIDGRLLYNWRLAKADDQELAKILLYYAAEHISQKLQEGTLERIESITLEMEEHLEPYCPVEVSEITTIVGYSFDVPIPHITTIPIPQESLFSLEVTALILSGETQTVEFKEAVCRSPYTGKKDNAMPLNIVKAAAALMNAQGGALLIGVADDGAIKGVAVEYPFANPGNPTWDGYALYLADLLNNNLQVETPFQHYTLTRHTVEGQDVCCVVVRPSAAPVYVDKHFYVRTGAQSRELHGPDLLEYVRERWGCAVRG